MLDSKELKIVLATLTQRRAWILKQLESSEPSKESRDECIGNLKVLESAMQKLSRLAPSPTKTDGPSTPPPSTRGKKKTHIDPEDAYVLIAEDNADSAELLRGVLEDMKIKHIDVVIDGRAAVFALQNCSPPYDIVLCDWNMPEMNGLEVRKAIKNLAKLQDTHFMMVTALSEAAHIREAIGHGINDYIIKPIDTDVLEKKLKAALAGTAMVEAVKHQ